MISGLIGSLLILFWPVQNLNDFNINSILYPLGLSGPIVGIFIISSYLALKTSGKLKKTGIGIIISSILYIGGSILVLSNIIDIVNANSGVNLDLYFYIISGTW